MIDIQNLKRVAQATFTKNWKYGGIQQGDFDAKVQTVFDENNDVVIGEYGASGVVCEFVAAANPAVVSELIQMIIETQANYEDAANKYSDCANKYMQLADRLNPILIAAERQCDHMAFIINHMDLPEQWHDKFVADLAVDREVIAKSSQQDKGKEE